MRENRRASARSPVSPRSLAFLTVLGLLYWGCSGTGECRELCGAWPEATRGQIECAERFLEAEGYAVGTTPACIGVETEDQCGRCGEVLGVTNTVCRTVYSTCFLGSGIPAPSSPDAVIPAGEASGGRPSGEGASEAGATVGREGVRIEAEGVGGGFVEIGRDGVRIEGGGPPRPRAPGPPEESAEEDPPLVRCPANEDCFTPGNGRYRLECAGTNCDLTCSTGSQCITSCEANCNIAGERGARLEIFCGANCDIGCAPDAVCVVDCPGGNCRCEGEGCRRVGS